MSIVLLERATFVGLSSEKARLLDDLHRFGSLQIIPLAVTNMQPLAGRRVRLARR